MGSPTRMKQHAKPCARCSRFGYASAFILPLLGLVRAERNRLIATRTLKPGQNGSLRPGWSFEPDIPIQVPSIGANRAAYRRLARRTVIVTASASRLPPTALV